MESFYNVHQGKYALLELPTARMTRKCPGCACGHAAGNSPAERRAGFLGNAQRSHYPAARAQRTGDSVPQPARLFDFTPMSPVRVCCRVPNCSVSLTYHRQMQKLCCHICGFESAAPAVCPEANCGNPEIRYAGLGTRKWRISWANCFLALASNAWIQTRSNARKTTAMSSAIFARGRSIFSWHPNDCQGPALSQRHFGGNHLCGLELAPARFPRQRADVSNCSPRWPDAPVAAMWKERSWSRLFSPYVRLFNMRAGMIRTAFTTRRSSSVGSLNTRRSAGSPCSR